GQLALEALHELLASELREHGTCGLVGSQRTRLDLAPALLRHLALEVADLVRKAPLPQALREDHLHRADHPRRSVAREQKRIIQSARVRVAQDLAAARRILLRARRQPQ